MKVTSMFTITEPELGRWKPEIKVEVKEWLGFPERGLGLHQESHVMGSFVCPC